MKKYKKMFEELKVITKKWKDGAEKHGGFLPAIEKELGGVFSNLDKSLGKPSGVFSSIPEKREESKEAIKMIENALTKGSFYPGKGSDSHVEEEVVDIVTVKDKEVKKKEKTVVEVVKSKDEVQEEHVIDIYEKNLGIALLKYLCHDSVDENEAEDIMLFLIKNRSLSNKQVASKVLAYGNKDISSQVKAWVLNHINEDVTFNKLKLSAAKYYIDHSNEKDVSEVIREAKEGVEEFASALFATNHPELSIQVASCLIGDLVETTSDI